MITKDPKMRAEWSEIFSYEIRNGELFRAAIRNRTPKSVLKKSYTFSQTTNASAITSLEPTSNKPPPQQQPESNSQLIYNPRQYNNDLRSTYSAKSPFR